MIIPLLPIHTPRLTLRQFTTDDLEAFQAYRTDPVVALYQGWQPTSDDEARAFLVKQAQQAFGPAGQWLQVAVVLRDSAGVIGDLGLCVTDESGRAAELGFSIARHMQGHGYATEAVTAVLDVLLGKLGMHSVVAVTDVRNIASVALLRRVGFEQTQTKAAVFRGEPCEEHTFVMTHTWWACHRRTA